jgi:hypothetical protein
VVIRHRASGDRSGVTRPPRGAKRLQSRRLPVWGVVFTVCTGYRDLQCAPPVLVIAPPAKHIDGYTAACGSVTTWDYCVTYAV